MHLLGCVFVLLVFMVRAQSFRKKNKEFKTALITSYTLLLWACAVLPYAFDLSCDFITTMDALAISYHLYNLKNVKAPMEECYFRKVVLKLKLLHGCFSRFVNCINDAKSRKASHM